MVRDAFQLPQINEALQAINNCQWFTSFDLAQGYLQMPVAESDIHNTTFRTVSSGLYAFTHMAFGLYNCGSSFCYLIEMCLGDQWCMTLLLYLEDICLFAASIDQMLGQIEMFFFLVWKNLIWKLNQISVIYFSTALSLWGMHYL